MRAILMDIYPGYAPRADRARWGPGHVRRCVTSLVMFAVLATTPLVHAQAVPSVAACSNQAWQGLRNIGAWAEAQCAYDQSLAFAPAFLERCTDQVLLGLRRVGAWAEMQCAVGDQMGSN